MEKENDSQMVWAIDTSLELEARLETLDLKYLARSGSRAGQGAQYQTLAGCVEHHCSHSDFRHGHESTPAGDRPKPHHVMAGRCYPMTYFLRRYCQADEALAEPNQSR